jgi:hypothetical protein
MAVAHIALHPRPRPPKLHVQDWYVLVTSADGGRTAERPVRVRYQHPWPDNPERLQRDGIILVLFTIAPTALAVALLVTLGPAALFRDTFKSVNDFLAVALPVTLLASWWIVSVRTLVKGRVGRRGRRKVRGVVVGRHSRPWRSVVDDEPYDLYYLAIDDGTREMIEGWEVPRHVFDLFPPGVEAEAVVSDDGRYPYSIAQISVT